jgi:ubiquinone biosynthesis protein UbiJ
VDRADFQQAVFEQLADAQALGAGEGEIELAGDAAFEQVQVLGARRWA